MAGVVVVASHDYPLGLAAIASFGFGLTLGIAMLVNPAQLQVTEVELKFDSLWRHSTYDLHHCGEFRVIRGMAFGSEFVAFPYDGP